MKKFFLYTIFSFSMLCCLFFLYPSSVSFADASDFDFVGESEIHIYGVNPSAIVDGVLTIPSEINGIPVVSLSRSDEHKTESPYVKLFKAGMTSLDLSQANNLEYIEKLCFKNSNLQGSIHFPSSLQKIESGAFSNTHITEIYIPDTTSCIALASSCFNHIEHIYFSSDTTLQMYKSADVWSTYADKMELSTKTTVVTFEGLEQTQTKVVGKPFSYSQNQNVWSDDSSYSFPTPSRDMYDFVGWSIDGISTISENDIVPDSEYISLTAIWAERTHNISYICDFTTLDFQTQFVESQGYDLPVIDLKDISYTWDGWYLDQNYSQKISRIDAGTNTDISLYSKKSKRNMSINITLPKNIFLYSDDISLTYSLQGVPSDFQTQATWYIYDSDWNQSFDSISNLDPGQYNIRCVVLVSYNNQSLTLENNTSIVIEKHKVSVTWDDTEEYPFANENITPFVQASCSSLQNAYKVSIYKYHNEQWILCDMFDAGLYKVSVEPNFDYVQILGTPSKQFTVSPLPVDLGYTTAYMHIVFGQTYTPELTPISLSTGFNYSYVTEQISLKTDSTWYDYSSRTLDQPISKLKNVVAVGQYQYRLILNNPNYIFSESNTSLTLEIDKQPLFISWKNISFEYDGLEHSPSATTTNIANENIPVSVTGAKIYANTKDTPTYTALATITDPNYILQNPTTDFTISKTSAFISADFTEQKFYDGEKSQISAVVKDKNGVFDNNVAIFCPTDLTSVGIHEVSLSWSGDLNHFSAQTITILITIKTQNILYGEEDSPKLAIESTNGFDNLNDIVINERKLETLNLQKQSYSDLTALYDIKNIYSLSSQNTDTVSLNMSIPSDIQKLSDLKVLKLLSNGTVQQVDYVVSEGRIKILSSETNATYILVVKKDNSNLTTILLLSVGLVCATLLAVCLLSISHRKHNHNLNKDI